MQKILHLFIFSCLSLCAIHLYGNKEVRGEIGRAGHPLKSNSEPKAFFVMIDPGHGGSDLGAKQGDFFESKLTLKLAEKLKASLNQEKNIRAELTRGDDSLVTLNERVNLAHQNEADIFISLHANASVHPSAKGAEFFIRTGESQKDPRKVVQDPVWNIIDDLSQMERASQSYALSKKIKNNWNPEHRKKRHPIKQASFFVVNNTKIPSVLIEIGFITNASELKRLMSPHYQEEMVRNMHLSILKFKESLDTGPRSHLN